MIQQAVNNEWDSDGLKPGVIDVVEKCLLSSDDRVRMRAAEIVLKMVEQNRKREQTSQLHSDRNRFLEIAERLGLDSGTGRTAETGTGGGTPIVDGSIIRRT